MRDTVLSDADIGRSVRRAIEAIARTADPTETAITFTYFDDDARVAYTVKVQRAVRG